MILKYLQETYEQDPQKIKSQLTEFISEFNLLFSHYPPPNKEYKIAEK